jgi:hypothetical protein
MRVNASTDGETAEESRRRVGQTRRRSKYKKDNQKLKQSRAGHKRRKNRGQEKRTKIKKAPVPTKMPIEW